ncbi:MAG: TraB/GumN family protein [Lysobacter sp.]
MQAALLMGLVALAGASPLVSTAAEAGPQSLPVTSAEAGPQSLPVTSVDAATGTDRNAIRDLDAVMVTGMQPGPGMWKVSRGDHEMWVLGVVSPLPEAMTWQSSEVEAVIARAGQVLQSPMWSVYSDVGLFKGLSLLPAALRARRNPGDAELGDVLPPALYARWEVQKDKYLGWEFGIERWRPMFAAEKLERKAMERLGFDGNVVAPVINAAAQRAGLEPTLVQVRTTVDAPRELLKEFNRASLDDAACLERTVAMLEHEVPTLVARANAWASGDVEALRQLPHDSLEWSCLQSVLQSDIGRRLGYDDMPMQIERAWLDAAEQALAKHAVTLAVLPMDQVLAADGYLAKLQGRGYTVALTRPPASQALPQDRPVTAPAAPADVLPVEVPVPR